MSPTTLIASHLTRRFAQREAVRDVSLTLRRGEVLGLLGHNGAGKSTTLQMLAGVLLPHSGQIEIGGFDLAKDPLQAKSRIGFLPETPPLYRDMHVADYLCFAARLHRVPREKLRERLAYAVERCGLVGVEKKIIGTLSKGYQQRAGIAQAIIHKPDVIILDEPTAGLDPAQLRDIRLLIRELGDAHSVILSTHILGEVASVCDRVEIIHQGRLIYGDSSAKMRQYGKPHGFTVTLNAPPALDELQAIHGVLHVEPLSSTQFRILHEPDANPGAALLALAAERGWQAQELAPLETELEDVFLRITTEQGS